MSISVSDHAGGTARCPRLRIAYVVHDYHRYGGHSRYVAELACRFRRDHDVHVFTNTVDDADRDGITFHHVPAWRRNALTTVLQPLCLLSESVPGIDRGIAAGHGSVYKPLWSAL